MFGYYLLGIPVCDGVTDANIMWVCVLFKHICVYVCWENKEYIAAICLSTC